jgi:hypothetical protein
MVGVKIDILDCKMVGWFFRVGLLLQAHSSLPVQEIHYSRMIWTRSVICEVCLPGLMPAAIAALNKAI